MPMPVSSAKQCLNSDASHALDQAVAFTRRRGHAQTTSLHAVSSFLSLPSSQLREACIRARNTAVYPPRVHLKALDFCLSVALERLPSSQSRVDEPPVSNSLMAAIKRSQANQRRQPESISAVRNQNHEQLGSSCSGIKVELQHLIVSILDDPIVSRVFNDAGFRNFDVKLAILRPFQTFFRYRGNQGLFLCSNSNVDGILNPGYRPFRFPFSGSCEWGEDYKRIGEVLVRKKGRNPLLVGVCANDSFRGFVEVLEGRKEVNILPLEVYGIKVVSFEKDLLKFASENWSDEAMNSRFKEVGMMVENSVGPGLMVSFGNLRFFLGGVDGFGMDMLNSIVRNLTKLLEDHGDRIWLIGFATNDQTYMEFLSRFPAAHKSWDLHLLPIPCLKPLVGGETSFKYSLMGSFVPFGGFFSSPSDLKAPLTNSYQHLTRDNPLNETNAFPRRGSIASVPDQHKTENSASNYTKAKDRKMLGDSVEGFPKRDSQLSPESETSRECLQLPTAMSSYNYQRNAKIANVEKHLSSHSSKSVLRRSSKNDTFLAKQSESLPSDSAKCSTHPSFNLAGISDFDNSKTLFEALFGRVGRQSNAVRKISHVITDSWTSTSEKIQKPCLRGDIWLNLTGPDSFGKIKVAMAVAKILYGNEHNIIHVNFLSKLGEKVFGQQISYECDVRFRGKTIVDHIAEELRRTPFGVIFLKNVHFADPVAQQSLSKAIKTGKFSDSHGREIPINNRIFLLTSEENAYIEERIVRAKGWPIQVTVTNTNNKKKRAHRESGMCLDLNLPAEINDDDYDNDRGSESWFDEFSNEVVKVVFDPFDYDALSSKILKWVHRNMCKIFGFECALEIEPTVMEQILVSACLSPEGEREVEDWVEHVLGKGFAEAQKIYQISAHSVITVTSGAPLEKVVETRLLPSKIVLT